MELLIEGSYKYLLLKMGKIIE